MRIAGLLTVLLFTAATFAQSIVTPVFVLKDGDASTVGYTGSDKDIVVDGGSQQNFGWITFQMQGIDFTRIEAAKLTLYVKTVTRPGTLQIRLLTSDITAPENNVKLTDIPADVAITTSIAIGTADVEKMIQFDLTPTVKAGTFKGVALASNDGLSATFDSKEGRLAPVILLTHNVADAASKWLNGTDSPSSSLGKDGDYYLNSSNGDVSVKSSETWSIVTNVVGPAGPAGTAGPKGDKGDQGTPGVNGADGAQGPKGDPGVNGTNGSQGPAGVDGRSIVWRMAWSADSSYSANDAVSYSGNSYIAIKASANKVPVDSVSYWSPMANKGDNGDPGVALDDAQVLTTKTWSSSKINGELGIKVDKEKGKGLSSEDFTTDEKKFLTEIRSISLATKEDVAASLSGKVDKVTGKGLSTKDYTAADSNKLVGIAVDAVTRKGDMQYWDGTKWVRIPVGKHGQVLSSTSSESPVWQYPSTGTVTDTDGNIYQTIRIGNQEWTTENLRTTKYSDGTSIILDTNTSTWGTGTEGKYCFYNNADSSKVVFGALYNWYAVNTGKLAPKGWHVPNDAEWDTLQSFLIAHGYNWDGTTTGNKIAKALAAKSDWGVSGFEGTIGNNLNWNNRSGFSALGCGQRTRTGYFNAQHNFGGWWSATAYDASYAWYRNLYSTFSDLLRSSYYESCGFSVRLVRDLN